MPRVARRKAVPPRDRLRAQVGSADEARVRRAGPLDRDCGRRQARLVGELRLRGPWPPAEGHARDAVSGRQRVEDADRGDRRAAERTRTAGRRCADSRVRRGLPAQRPGADRAPARRSSRRHPSLRGRRGDQHEALQLGHGQPEGLRRRPARRAAGGAVPLLELRLQPAGRGRRDGDELRGSGRRSPRRSCSRWE